jgi:hypothetical protein
MLTERYSWAASGDVVTWQSQQLPRIVAAQ